jgi:predicted RNA-binding protein (virulence factor B family)
VCRKPLLSIDLSLNKTGHTHVAPLTQQIMTRLEENNGHLDLSDI